MKLSLHAPRKNNRRCLSPPTTNFCVDPRGARQAAKTFGDLVQGREAPRRARKNKRALLLANMSDFNRAARTRQLGGFSRDGHLRRPSVTTPANAQVLKRFEIRARGAAYVIAPRSSARLHRCTHGTKAFILHVAPWGLELLLEDPVNLRDHFILVLDLPTAFLHASGRHSRPPAAHGLYKGPMSPGRSARYRARVVPELKC